MNLVDRIVLKRLGSRILLAVAVMFGILVLAESLNVWRFEHLSRAGGPILGLVGIVTSATRWSLGVLPVTLLIGAIIGLLDLQARREMTVIKSTGRSIWSVLRAPALAVVVVALAASLLLDTMVVLANRALNVSLPQSGSTGTLWLEQSRDGVDYVLYSLHPRPAEGLLEDVTVFVTNSPTGERIHAKSVQLENGTWYFPEAIRFRPDSAPELVRELRMATYTTRADLGVKFANSDDLTIFEAFGALSSRVTDVQLRNRLAMRVAELMASPLVLVGSLLIAFAFTAGYRRTNKYGVAVLYGVVLGFVVYVTQEMASMAGGAGVLNPGFAAAGPALVAIVIGVTVLLHKEDGRA